VARSSPQQWSAIKCLGRWVWTSLICATLGLAVCGRSFAMKPARPPDQAAAVTSAGVVWFDDGPIFFQPFGSIGMHRVSSARRAITREVESSTSAVVLPSGERQGGEERLAGFLAGAPTGRLRYLRDPRLFAGAGCRGWEPAGRPVLAGDYLVVAGGCYWDDRVSRTPVFVRNLHAGGWRILRWFCGGGSPELAAEGSLLAIGVEACSARMTVTILDLRDGRVRHRLTLPDGELSFASPSRLVVFSPVPVSQGDGCGCQNRILLYSLNGRRIGDFGVTSDSPLLVSHMHLVTKEWHEGPPEEGEYFSVRDLAGDASRPPRLIEDLDPMSQEAVAFRWPALAVVQSRPIQLLPSEIGCWTGDSRPGKPSLRIFDLARDEPVELHPPLPEVRPSELQAFQ
jgi:hypothetical protein